MARIFNLVVFSVILFVLSSFSNAKFDLVRVTLIMSKISKPYANLKTTQFNIYSNQISF